MGVILPSSESSKTWVSYFPVVSHLRSGWPLPVTQLPVTWVMSFPVEFPYYDGYCAISGCACAEHTSGHGLFRSREWRHFRWKTLTLIRCLLTMRGSQCRNHILRDFFPLTLTLCGIKTAHFFIFFIPCSIVSSFNTCSIWLTSRLKHRRGLGLACSKYDNKSGMPYAKRIKGLERLGLGKFG